MKKAVRSLHAPLPMGPFSQAIVAGGFVLVSAGVDFSHAVKCSIFLKDMNDYARVNKVYSSYFSEPYPARETIQVVDLPKHVNIEISVIAVQG